VPWAEGVVIADLNVGILYLFAISSLGVYGIIMGGWASNSKYPFLGGLRSAAQMVSYEVSIGFIIITVLLLVGSLNLSEIVDAQRDGIWMWHAFRLFNIADFPGNILVGVTMLAMLVMFFVSALAETNRPPFDLPEAESELTAGFHTEYSGMRFGMFFLPEYAMMLSLSAVASALFLGGYHDPFGLSAPGGAFAGAWGWGLLWFFLKTTFLFLSQIALRWTLPRIRIDQVMYLCYKVLLPIGMGCLVLAAALRLLG
jgi:NADH-quinone oxidoreductase subunit H